MPFFEDWRTELVNRDASLSEKDGNEKLKFSKFHNIGYYTEIQIAMGCHRYSLYTQRYKIFSYCCVHTIKLTKFHVQHCMLFH